MVVDVASSGGCGIVKRGWLEARRGKWNDKDRLQSKKLHKYFPFWKFTSNFRNVLLFWDFEHHDAATFFQPLSPLSYHLVSSHTVRAHFLQRKPKQGQPRYLLCQKISCIRSFLFVKLRNECACISIGRMEDIHKAFPGGRGKGTLAVYIPIQKMWQKMQYKGHHWFCNTLSVVVD